MSRICMECGNKFVGRLDKKFCCTQCRSSYHNRMNSDTTAFIRNVNIILRKNRRILERLNPTGKTKVNRNILMEQGFKFGYFTNQYITKAGNVYHFCYDQGYLELGENLFALVIRKEYVD